MKDRKSHHESHSLGKTARDHRFDIMCKHMTFVTSSDASSIRVRVRADRPIMSVKTEHDTAFCWLTNNVTAAPCDVPGRTSIFECRF